MADDTEEQRDWTAELKDMSSDEIKNLIDKATDALKKRDAKKRDEKPASELTDDELRASHRPARLQKRMMTNE